MPAIAGRRRRHIHEPHPGATVADYTRPILLGLILLSAILRFSSITVPTIWGDEAAVAWRTCGSYTQFVEVLKNDGFVPLHYSYYWLLKHFLALTPFVLRLLPTIASICMVPAMYFLARELVSRQSALVVAAFAAVSGHLGWHAQDAKMYSHFWLMGTLCMGSFLWWLRTGRGIAFWCWTATGVCTVGLHSLGWGLIALQPLLMVFRGKPAGRSWWFFALGIPVFLLGMALIAAGPAGYYLGFNRWTQNIQSRGWDASGIAWIKMYFTPDPLPLIRDTTNHFLFGYDFPPAGFEGVSPIWAWSYVAVIPLYLYTLLAFALFPYPTRERGRGQGDAELSTAWWRSALCLGAWVLLPPYAFYCASVENYAWPAEVLRTIAAPILAEGLLTMLTVGLIVLAMYCCGATWRDRLWRWLQFATVTAAILLIATAIAWALRNRPPGPLWVSRYLGFVWPGFVIAVFALLGRLPIRWLRWSVIGMLLAINLWVVGSRVLFRQDPPLDRFAADFIAAQQPNSTTQAHAIGMSPREKLSIIEGRYYLFLYSGRPTTPDEFAGGDIASMFSLPEGTVTDNIEEAFLASPDTKRIIVWQQVALSRGPRTPPPIPRDKLLARLPQGWQCISEELIPWTSRWGSGGFSGAWSRREFVAGGQGSGTPQGAP